jgi:hypothetical protein
MKKALLAALLGMVLVVPLAYAYTPPGNVLKATATVTCAGSPCTGAAPNATTDGATLAQMRSISIRLCADSGQTLSGGGTLDVYAMDEADGLWSLVPELEITIDASVASDRCAIVLSDRDTPLGWGRVSVVPNAVTLSSGNLTISYYRRAKALP